jgi:hypothetical protein
MAFFFVVFTFGYDNFSHTLTLRSARSNVNCYSFVGYKLTLFFSLGVVAISTAVKQDDNSKWRTE